MIRVSPKEFSVFSLLKLGMSTEEIAQKLGGKEIGIKKCIHQLAKRNGFKNYQDMISATNESDLEVKDDHLRKSMFND